MKIYLDKLYKDDIKDMQMSAAIPFKKGKLYDVSSLAVYDKGIKLKSQAKATARYADGSVRFAFVRFIADVPGNCEYFYKVKTEESEADETDETAGIALKTTGDGYSVDTGKISFTVENYSEGIFKELNHNGRVYAKDDFVGPRLSDYSGNQYDMKLGAWKIKESGPLCVILAAEGENTAGTGGCEEGKHIRFVVTLTVRYGESSVDIAYRLINSDDEPLKIKSLQMYVKMADKEPDYTLVDMDDADKIDSTGCADMDILLCETDEVLHTIGPRDLARIEELAPSDSIRTAAGASNYRTDFLVGKNGHSVIKLATAKKLMKEANEHFAEVFYGAFFADRTDAVSGIAASIYQAQQNYPKAVKADEAGVYVFLVPEGEDRVVMQSGMSREQSFQLLFHDKEMGLEALDSHSLIYQLKPQPYVSAKKYEKSGAVTDVFASRYSEAFEVMLEGSADAHSRSFGMLNFGDTIDMHYTEQGRGGDLPVWINNEYDYPHAQALMYMRSGIRRFREYAIVHAKHQMDVDICHYSSDPKRIGGQIEHTAGHVLAGVLVPSHQWCEGLLDYYHLTGDERGLECALGLGENVLKLLEDPAYQNTGEANARETGWALRLFTALYDETNDKKWLEKCDWIVGHFEEWLKECGCFGAQYTDNTLVRTGFMTAVAIGSLMRYYRHFPSESLKKLIMAAVDDIYDNCRLKNGLFYYKELPSLARNGGNPLLLEAMAVGYELTRDVKYLAAGKRTLTQKLISGSDGGGSTKKIMGDAIMQGKGSTKNFAQLFYPLTVYYKMLCEAGLDDFLAEY